MKKIGMLLFAVLSLFIFSSQVFAFTCTWSDDGTCNCNVPGSPISYSGSGNQGLFKVNMSQYTNLYMSVEFQDPSGWVFNVGDSPTNNGYGGDAGTFYNDAEMQILNTQMSGYFNQYDYLNPGSNVYASPSCNPYAGLRCPYPSFIMDGVLLPKGITVARFQLQDQFFWGKYSPTNANLKMQSPYLLRLGGKDHEASGGLNDKIWYVGANRVISPCGRIGKGAKKIWFTFTATPLPQTPCDSSPVLPPIVVTPATPILQNPAK